MRVKVDNMIIEGSEQDICDILDHMKLRGSGGFDLTQWHYSVSKNQWIKINDIDTNHLVNIIVKEMRLTLDQLSTDYMSKKIDVDQFRRELVNFPSNTTFVHLHALFNELLMRGTRKGTSR